MPCLSRVRRAARRYSLRTILFRCSHEKFAGAGQAVPFVVLLLFEVVGFTVGDQGAKSGSLRDVLGCVRGLEAHSVTLYFIPDEASLSAAERHYVRVQQEALRERLQQPVPQPALPGTLSRSLTESPRRLADPRDDGAVGRARRDGRRHNAAQG